MFLVNSRPGLFCDTMSPWSYLSRSYVCILPSSLTLVLSYALEYSSRVPVSVCGTVLDRLCLEIISWQPESYLFAQAEACLPITPCLTLWICLQGSTAKRLDYNPISSRYFPPASFHRIYQKYRNINLFPISYAFQPRLRGRLTLGRLPSPRKPYTFGGQESHLPFRYSCLHPLFL